MKRFTETNKWTDSWFSELNSSSKLLWVYMCDKCDCIGMYDISKRVACFETGISESQHDKAMKELESRFVAFKNGKLFLKKFIEFQYGTLNESCKPHQKYMKELKKQRVWELYTKGMDTLQEKEEEKEVDKEGDGLEGEGTKKVPKNHDQSGVQDDLGLPPELDRYGLPMKYDLDEVAREIYKEYPRKDGITEAVKKIKKAFTLIHPIVLYRIVRAYGMLVDQSEERKQFIPQCTTWMNQCKWEADAPIANPPKYVYDPAYEAGDEMWQIEQHKQRVQQFRVDREDGLKAWNEAKALLERMQDDAR